MLVRNVSLRKIATSVFQIQKRDKSNITYDSFREQHLCHFYGRDSFIPKAVTNLRDQFREKGLIPSSNKPLMGVTRDIITSNPIVADNHTKETLQYSLQVLNSIYFNEYQIWRRYCLKIPYDIIKGVSSGNVNTFLPIDMLVKFKFFLHEKEIANLNRKMLHNKLSNDAVSYEFRRLSRHIFIPDI